MAYCRYYDAKGQHTSCKSKSLNDILAMLNALSFLTSHTDRTSVKVGIKVRIPVEIPESLDLTVCTKRSDKKNAYSYKLTAVINHFGFGTAKGHYTATLLTDNDVMTYDDMKIIK